MKIAVVDTETTGLDKDNDRIVELAVTTIDAGKKSIVDTWSTFVAPHGAKITPYVNQHGEVITPGMSLEARATHHITDKELEGAPTLEQAIKEAPLSDVDFFCAHNAAFDRQFLTMDVKWLCTYRTARHLYPDAPRHTNQVLRYYLDLNDKLYEAKPAPIDDRGWNIMLQPPHRALVDTWVTAHILLEMLEMKEPRDIHVLSNSPVLEKVCRFGKHAGTEWSKVPRDYLSWIIRTGGFDPDVMHTARHYSGSKS